MNKIVVLMGLILLSTSCKNNEKTQVNDASIKQSYAKIEQLQWLVGNWTNRTTDQQSYENWIKKNDSTLIAHSYTMVLKDTVFQENMVIQQKIDSVVLIVSVPNQNDEKPIAFGLLSTENEAFTFVNEHHDFPNRISYSNPVKDSIHAWIEGQIDSTYKKIDFYFKRSN